MISYSPDEHEECKICHRFHLIGAACPDYVEPETPPPPKPTRFDLLGRIVAYDWPGEGWVVAMIVSDPDADGKVGLMVLHENVRVNVDDVERIDDGRNLSTT